MASNAIQSQSWPNGGDPAAEDISSRTKVLLVEDDPELLDELYDIIQLEGWKPLFAHSTEAAMRRLQADPDINVVVTDVHFANGVGKANGIQFISRARAAFAGRDLTYVVVSGDPGKMASSELEGACSFLPKPLDADRLIAIISDAVSGKG